MKSPITLALVAVIITLSSVACQRGPSSPASAIATAEAKTQTATPEKPPAEKAAPTMLTGPNAVPEDTRIVVNIPAFRMDLFRDGNLVKSYKIGIGYPEFQLPRGFRKAEMIVFNPTWTQPNESWASNPGEVVPAGAKGNPLGPIKIPIGGANLIHGGKALAKIGNFASHGCVGMTNEQVKDFAKVLADATNTPLSSDQILSYLRHPTRTQAVKLAQVVPVELRYETIVVEDGKLHIYRDVYGLNTNTEENLRAAFTANGREFDSLSEEEKTQALDALNAMSLRPKRSSTSKPTEATNLSPADKKALAAERKAEADRLAKLRRQREIVVEVPSLIAKGYPSPKDLNTGKTNSIEVTLTEPAKPKPMRRNATPTPQSSPRTNPTPAPQSTPVVVQPPRSTASPQ
jgi:lipoprotein-anchoring transpeptidase ErfK/SrfK